MLVNPMALPRRVSVLPLMASVGPLLEWRWRKTARMSCMRRLNTRPSDASSRHPLYRGEVFRSSIRARIMRSPRLGSSHL